MVEHKVEPPASPDPLAGVPQYTKVKDLGIGSFGSVALYQRDEGRGEPSLCAVKFMPRSGPGVDVNLIQREIQSHRVLRHPHVIRFKQLGLTPTHIFMCMEYADQGDLLGFLRRKGPLPEADARWLFQQVIFGLDYCHLKGVVNRDLKPENLLLKLTPEASKRHRRHQMQEREQQQRLWEQMQQMHLQQHLAPAGAAGGAEPGSPASGGALRPQSPAPPPAPPALPPLGVFEHRTSNTFNLHIKIADFGLSKRAVHSLPKTRVGTINYMAPEVLLAGPSQRYDGAKADIWSAGVVLYAMLFSRVPFESVQDQQAVQQAQAQGGPPPPTGARDRAATIQRILAGEWAVPPGMSVSPQCLHLLTQLLVPDPVRRSSMTAIMEHPWFRAGLPPAALTMNTALVRQQAAQGAAAGDQTEAEIDGLLEELRRQAEAETRSAMVAAMAASTSRSSDDVAEERRVFEVQGLAEEEPAAPAAARKQQQQPQHMMVPRVLNGGGAGGGGGGAMPAPVVRPSAAAGLGGGDMQRRYACVDTLAAVNNGGGGRVGGMSPHRMHSPRGGAGADAGPQRGIGAAGATFPVGAAPNAFVARLACLGPDDVVTASSGAGGSGGAGGGAGCGPPVLAPGSSMSRRAEELDSIDFIAGRG